MTTPTRNFARRTFPIGISLSNGATAPFADGAEMNLRSSEQTGASANAGNRSNEAKINRGPHRVQARGSISFGSSIGGCERPGVPRSWTKTNRRDAQNRNAAPAASPITFAEMLSARGDVKPRT